MQLTLEVTLKAKWKGRLAGARRFSSRSIPFHRRSGVCETLDLAAAAPCSPRLFSLNRPFLSSRVLDTPTRRPFPWAFEAYMCIPNSWNSPVSPHSPVGGGDDRHGTDA